MKYMVDSELFVFPAWAGAAPRLKELCRHEAAYNYISNMIEDWASSFERPVEDVDINDYIWFNMDNDLCEAGYMNDDGDCTSKADGRC